MRQSVFLVFISLLVLSCKCQSRWYSRSQRNTRYRDLQPSSSDRTCEISETTASGKYAPKGEICSGQLIFEENFDRLDRDLWEHELTLGGGGNWEFQWYVDDRDNSFAENGKLIIRPTLTVDTIGELGLENDVVKLNPCTNDQWYGCERTGSKENIINPIRSARIRTNNSFSFKYGKVEIVAKLPTGDWLWPAMWLLPTNLKYGTWPRSGEIDLVETRGNRNYVNHKGEQLGVEHTSSTLHFGPAWDQNGYQTATYSKHTPRYQGYNKGFHKFQMEWKPEYILFSVDDEEYGRVVVDKGFWERGHIQGDNIWKTGTKSAPFDDEFHFIFNLAVGGVNGFFPDTGNETPKPWMNSSPHAATDFWKGRHQWLPGWNLDRNDTYDASLVIDSVKVWAL